MSEKDSNRPTVPQSSRSRKLSQAQQIYTCECGKKYLTFSALYLHVKNKHDVRLTTKKSEQNCRTQVLSNKKYITYFIKQQSDNIKEGKDQGGDKGERFRRIVKRYAQSLQDEGKRGTIGLLDRYFDEISEDLRSKGELPGDLVYYFNQFVLYYLPKETKCSSDVEGLRGYAETIIEFWGWLKRQELTETEVRLHEAYQVEETSTQK